MKAFKYLAALGLGATVSLGETASAGAQVAAAQAEIEASEQITASAIALVPTQPLVSGVEQAPPASEPIAPEPIAPEPIEPPLMSLEPGIPLEVVPAIISPEGSVELAAPVQEDAAQAVDIAQADAEVPPAVEGAVEDAIPANGSPAAEGGMPEVDMPNLDASSAEAVEPAVQRSEMPTSDSPVPVDSNSIDDPVEAEFEQEGLQGGSDATPGDGQTEATDAAPLDGLSEPAPSTEAEVEVEAAEVETIQGIVVDSTAPATTLVDQQPNLFRPDESAEVSIEVNEAISLETAIEIARQNNPGIRIRQLQLEQSFAAVDEARAAYAPQFSVNSSFDNSGTFTDTNELYREPDLGQDNDSNARDATVSLTGNARIDYGIIDPDRKAQVKAAEIAAEQAELTLEQELAELRLTVSQAYYQLQEADEQVNISEQAVISARRSLKDAQALEQAGVGTRFSVLQADVQLANEQQNLVNNLSAQQQSRRQLAQVLSTPEKLNLTASDPVASAGTWSMTLEASIIKAYENRVELDNQVLQRDLSDAQREIVQATTRPSLTAFAQAGPGLRYDFNRTDPEGSGDTTSGFRRGTLGYQAGLRFQWLFGDGGATKAAARQQALNKVIAEENFEATRDQVRGEVENAFYDLAANLRNIDTSEKGVVQADEALRLARLRFQAGVGTQSEVVDAERDLTTARGNRVTSILNYNRALVQIQRAIGETLVAPKLVIPAYVDGEG